jgi:NAD-dependent SIR2 family protein deacetylase
MNDVDGGFRSAYGIVTWTESNGSRVSPIQEDPVSLKFSSSSSTCTDIGSIDLKTTQKRKTAAQVITRDPFESRGGRKRVPRIASGLRDQVAVESTAYANLVALSEIIASGKQVVFVTGAGLSVASGIPPFRTSRNKNTGADQGAVWSRYIEAMGTKQMFLKDPQQWYENFWLPSFSPSKMDKLPNNGHEAISLISSMAENVNIITQNIDGLQQRTVTAWDCQLHLIEAHGRAGLFKCSSDCEGDCPYASRENLKPSAFNVETREQLGHGKTGLHLRDVPSCPHCQSPVLPQTLLFDEDYTDHEFYQFERLSLWLAQAECLVFVGTSFAVTLTSLCLDVARGQGLPLFNVNIDEIPERTAPTLKWNDIPGRAEDRLPQLSELVKSKILQLRLP